jgi:hypothetical protein
MTEFKLGTKHECSSCGTKFYDLEQPTAVCPKCGAEPGPPKDRVREKEKVRVRAVERKPGAASSDDEDGDDSDILLPDGEEE